MVEGPREQIHAAISVGMGLGTPDMAGHAGSDRLVRSVGGDAGSHRGAIVRNDVRRPPGRGSGSQGARHAQAAAGPADSARRSSRHRRCRRAAVKLAAYYLIVSAVFAGLAVKSPETASAAIVAFIALLLVPA